MIGTQRRDPEEVGRYEQEPEGEVETQTYLVCRKKAGFDGSRRTNRSTSSSTSQSTHSELAAEEQIENQKGGVKDGNPGVYHPWITRKKKRLIYFTSVSTTVTLEPRVYTTNLSFFKFVSI